MHKHILWKSKNHSEVIWVYVFHFCIKGTISPKCLAFKRLMKSIETIKLYSRKRYQWILFLTHNLVKSTLPLFGCPVAVLLIIEIIVCWEVFVSVIRKFCPRHLWKLLEQDKSVSHKLDVEYTLWILKNDELYLHPFWVRFFINII